MVVEYGLHPTTALHGLREEIPQVSPGIVYLYHHPVNIKQPQLVACPFIHHPILVLLGPQELPVLVRGTTYLLIVLDSIKAHRIIVEYGFQPIMV
jgi:hypothetical protein